MGGILDASCRAYPFYEFAVDPLRYSEPSSACALSSLLARSWHRFNPLRLRDDLAQGKNLLTVGSFFHHIHHRYFNCNYGNPEIPLDLWFGSYHDGSEVATRKLREKFS